MYMYVFQAIRACGFWEAHDTLFKRTPSIIENIDTILYMYVAVLLVFDRISYRTGEGRMRPNVVSTKLIATKQRSLDEIEN